MADARVLEAQQWVNATYRSVPGYVPVAENGVTGWSTMYALTRALQHELGITALSDNFGPGTMAALTARGGVRQTEANRNIVKIVQCGCFCKGYDPTAITGTFATSTAWEAVRSMVADYGGSTTYTAISAKTFKALLTMDAYTLLPGGSGAVRTVQRWLNATYLARRDFVVVPADGFFSRDVQKALYLAIQFELGLTDDQATGVFGPTTRAGLQAHPLAAGATGRWVQLFSASMVVNRVQVAGAVYTRFVATFDATLVTAVRAFQTFSALPVNGQGDYATWCQLLVSTGDPDRPGTAADCTTKLTPARAKALRAAGYRVVGRYLDNVPGGIDKKIQPGELTTIFAAGLRVFPISQYDGSTLAYFTYGQGFRDAAKAHTAAVAYGFDAGTVIYFAVDYDATQDDVVSNVVPYFQGVAAALVAKGSRYVHGVYGPRNVCSQVSSRTRARWSFVSGMSTGFSGNLGYPLPTNWSFNQIQTLTVGTGLGAVEIDKDVVRPGADPGVAAVHPPAATLEQTPGSLS